MVFKIKRKEGTYFLLGDHFAFNCACNSKEGLRITNKNSQTEILEDYSPGPRSQEQAYKYSYYITNILLEREIRQREECKEEPLELMCKGCGKMITLTKEHYEKVIAEMYIEKGIE